jgi:hypothetical protein
MSQGLKSLQTLARSCARRERNPGYYSDNGTPLCGQSFSHSQDSGFGSMTSSNGLLESDVMPLHALGTLSQIDIEASFAPKLPSRHENLDLSEPRLDEAIESSDPPDPRHTSQNRIRSGGVHCSHPPRLDGTNELTSETTSSQLNETSSEGFAPRIHAAENHPCKGKRSSDEAPIAPYTTATTSQSETPKFTTATSKMENPPGNRSNDPTLVNVKTVTDKSDTSVNSWHGVRSRDSNCSVPESQEGSPCTQEDTVSSAGSSVIEAYGNESDSSYEDLQTESTRQHFILLSFISTLRYRLHCQLMQAFRIKFRSEGTERGTPSTRNTSSGSISRGNASTNASSPSSSAREGSQAVNQAKSRASGKRRAAEDDGEEQDDGGSSKRPRKDPSDFVSPPERRRFPCPYYKLDPITFGNSVCEHGFKDIARLKYEQSLLHHLTYS